MRGLKRVAAMGLALVVAPSGSGIPGARGQDAAIGPSELVTVNVPDQVELQILVEFVGKSLGIHFVYGEELKDQRVELRPSPLILPKARLLNLLTSLLRVRDLALVEESPGFYRIVRSEQATRSVSTILGVGTELKPESMRIVTFALNVPSGDVKAVAEKLSPFLSIAKGGIVALPESQQIIITDYEARIALLQELVGVLSGEAAGITLKTIPVPSADASQLSQQVSALLAEQHRLRQAPGVPASVRSDIVPGSIVLMGTQEQIRSAEALVIQLAPAPQTLETRSYHVRYLNLDRARKLIDHVVLAPGSALERPTKMFEDPQSGRLFVTSETATLDAIQMMLDLEDRPLPEAERPLRLYRPKHRKAQALLTTLGQVLPGVALRERNLPADKSPKEAKTSPPGPNRPPGTPGPGQPLPLPPAQQNGPEELLTAQSLSRLEGPDFVVTADDHTNAILAIGSREFHAQLESLIEDLDRRRPQVLIEMTLVGITLGDTMDLGVELEGLDLGDAWDYLLFTNFGLSEIDVATGQRVLIPGVGGNGVLIRPDKVPALFRALATRAQAKVVSTPKLLVSDNASGTLRNVDEAPFTSVNASDTVATTSFAGFESAGTTLTVTPNISEGDYLTLEYNLTFSNFTGSSSQASIPPPRTTNSFTSTVEVPDGYTLITGGLVVDNRTESISEVPFLGRIPLLGLLFQSSARTGNKTKIFAFIRPTIVRDDEFEALKFATLKDCQEAGVDVQAASPEPMLWMR